MIEKRMTIRIDQEVYDKFKRVARKGLSVSVEAAVNSAMLHFISLPEDTKWAALRANQKRKATS